MSAESIQTVEPLPACPSKYTHGKLQFGCGEKPAGHMGVHRFFIEWTTEQQDTPAASNGDK